MPNSSHLEVAGPTPDQQPFLRDAIFNADSPGPLLHDFHVLLDFVGTAGVDASGAHSLLPIKILPTLNLHMHWKLEADLDRGQLRSYPNLQALFLLARSTGLIALKGMEKKRKLIVDTSVLQSWQTLTPTEQYFSLLVAWLLLASAEVLGEPRRRYESLLDKAFSVWQSVGKSGKRFSEKTRSDQSSYFGLDPDRYTVALMHLFGLLAVEQGKPIKGRPWIPQAVRQTDFGNALLTVLLEELPTENASTLDNLGENDDSDQEVEESEETEDSSGTRIIPLDRLQPFLQPYIPAWKNSLEITVEGFREGLLIFRVSLGKAWRKIAAPARATLEDLAYSILDSMEFDEEHLWTFSFRDRFGRDTRIDHPSSADRTEDYSADEIQVGGVPLPVGDAMEFRYDFGDDWRFKVQLERIDPPTGAKKLKVIESHGPAPRQYHYYDDDEDEDEDDEFADDE